MPAQTKRSRLEYLKGFQARSIPTNDARLKRLDRPNLRSSAPLFHHTWLYALAIATYLIALNIPAATKRGHRMPNDVLHCNSL